MKRREQNTPEDLRALNRWRLILGRFADGKLPFFRDGTEYSRMDQLLEYLYAREYGESRGVREGIGPGSLDPSNLTVPEWITRVKSLFPKDTVEVLEQHALRKYGLQEMLTDKDVLESMEANYELLKAVLQMKHLMKGDVIECAERIVNKVAEELRRKMEQEIRPAFSGVLNRNRTGGVRSVRNLDYRRTIRSNLKNWDPEEGRLLVDRVYFNRRMKRSLRWKIVIAVDQSGSMFDSVIHSAVMAGIFARLPSLSTHLVLFDTEVVDLTGHLNDPVRTLMSVQLGGGTNIGKALGYSYSLVESPHRTIVVLVSDLCEGAERSIMFTRTKEIVESGAEFLVLTSLDPEANPVYDRQAAEVMAELGASVAAMTPGKVAEWVAKILS